MSVDISGLVVQRYFIDKLTKEIARDKETLAEAWVKLQRQCTHPTVKTDRNYCSGGYDYLSSVKIVKTCTVCDKVLEDYYDPKHNGHYG